MALAVLYGKAVDDKTLGIYIDGVYFAGIAPDATIADQIAREAATTIRGGVAIVKIMPITQPNTLLRIFQEASTRFAKIEADMVETEATLEANAKRRKHKRRK